MAVKIYLPKRVQRALGLDLEKISDLDYYEKKIECDDEYSELSPSDFTSCLDLESDYKLKGKDK